MTRTFYAMRCTCGLRAVLHFEGYGNGRDPHMTGKKLTCREARVAHPYARRTAGTFVEVLRRAS